MNFCHCNDLDDSIAYDRLLANGQDWRDYLRGGTELGAGAGWTRHSWALTVLLNLPLAVVQAAKARHGEDVVLTLGQRRVTLPRDILTLDTRTADAPGWQATRRHLLEIAALARGVGARVIFAFYPSLQDAYAPWLGPDHLAAAAAAVAILHRIADKFGAGFVDYTPAIRALAGKDGFSAADTDYHPDDRGTAAMAEILLPALGR